MDKNLNEERMQVLKMIEEGKITSSEGLELLEALDKKTDVVPREGKTKWLKVRVKSQGDKTKANINIPLSLVDVGLKIGAKFTPDLKEAGLEKIDLEEIIEAIKNGAEGKIVEVDDEESDTRVEVYVE